MQVHPTKANQVDTHSYTRAHTNTDEYLLARTSFKRRYLPSCDKNFYHINIVSWQRHNKDANLNGIGKILAFKSPMNYKYFHLYFNFSFTMCVCVCVCVCNFWSIHGVAVRTRLTNYSKSFFHRSANVAWLFYGVETLCGPVKCAHNVLGGPTMLCENSNACPLSYIIVILYQHTT